MSRRGRPRDVFAHRERNGQKSRRKADQSQNEDVRMVVWEARQKHNDISMNQARDANAGSALGQLRIKNKIDDTQLAAGELAAKRYHRMLSVLGARDALTRSGNYSSPSFGDTGVERDQNVETVNDWDVTSACLQEKHALQVFKACVIYNKLPVGTDIDLLRAGLSNIIMGSKQTAA